MKLTRYALAGLELLLIFPSVLFMAALFVRNLQPQQFEPAHSAQQVVTWYAERPHVGLWMLLIALPLTVLLSGCTVLWRRWNEDADLRHAAQQIVAISTNHLANILVAAATITAGGVLAIVALHVLTD